MIARPDDDGPEPGLPDLDLEFPLGDGTADTEATVWCPWCGESVTIGLDPGSGATQAYEQDCEVCCRPWLVAVQYDAGGAATVSVEPAGDWDD